MDSGFKTRSVVVVGGGLVGLATAWRLLQSRRCDEVTLLEKDAKVASQQSTHNSGVLHSGLYYKPGSEKAALSVRGLRQMVAFCQEHGVRHEICGKIVVATDAAEVARLDTLWERGTQNGLVGLRRLDCPEAIRELEPHAAGIAAIHVPQEGIVDYRGVADALEREIGRLGGRVVVNARVTRIERIGGTWRLASTAGEVGAELVINCGGLHADRIVGLSGMKPAARIVPFRGEYLRLRPAAEHLVRHLIYPVPDPRFPFLGVHFTRMIDGGIEAGPNAVLAFAREGYTPLSINPRDLVESLTGLVAVRRPARFDVGLRALPLLEPRRLLPFTPEARSRGDAARPRSRRRRRPGPGDVARRAARRRLSFRPWRRDPPCRQCPLPRGHREPGDRRADRCHDRRECRLIQLSD